MRLSWQRLSGLLEQIVVPAGTDVVHEVYFFSDCQLLSV
jgi:hypothetical protein